VANNNPLVLNPDDEFEAVLLDMIKMHRKKSVAYGSDEDPFHNFYDSADMAETTPLRECESFMRKHLAALKNWWRSEQTVTMNPVPNRYSDDGYLDRAVYSVIALVLYRRGKS
jgi:hypothetical protein